MWFKYVLISLFILNTLMVVWTVGEPRKPIDRLTAVLSVIVNSLFVVGILHYWRN
jgi:hypothetical protein